MKKRIFILLTCLPLAGGAQRNVHTLEHGWTFYRGSADGAERVVFDDDGWASVTVPHTWNTDIIKNQINGDHYQGDGWYRLELPVVQALRGRRLFLRFEGALARAEVFLNGKPVGQHKGGYTAFCFEITDKIDWAGENLLAVKVNNADDPSIVPDGSRLFPRFGGIYRPVHLLVTDPVCITPLDYASSGVYIRQQNVTEKQAELVITTKVSNRQKKKVKVALRTTVIDAAGRVVAQKTGTASVDAGETAPMAQELKLENPCLWNGLKDPYLYAVKIEVRAGGRKVDEITEPLGIRFFHVDADRGVYLNGRPYRLYGVCRHQDWEHEGSALTDEHHRHDVSEMVEIGATAVRLAHYPQSHTMYDLCDTNGLVVWAEIPVVQGANLKKPGAFDNAKQQLMEMILQHYNHPSIFFWGLYNECWLAPEKVQEMHDLAKAEDPGRLTTAASHQKLSEKHFITDLICWNKYPKWYGNFDLETWADGLHEQHPEMKFGISEYGAGGCIDQHEIPPTRPNPTKGRFYPEEYMNLVHEQVWPMIDKRPYLWGSYLWNMFDFGWPGVTRGSRINLNNKGLISYDRKTRKDSFYYYKANWTDDPVLYITSRRFVNRTEVRTPVKVYSNCDTIELTVNGTAYPAPDGEYCVYRWPDILLQAGTNTVAVTGSREGELVTDTCVWVVKAGEGSVRKRPSLPAESLVYVSSSTASSQQVSKGNTAKKAHDGNPETFWCAGKGSLPQWIALDLLQSTDIGGVSIDWGQDGAYTYAVEVSDDGKNWKTMVEATGEGQSCRHEFDATAYFVRVVCKGTPNGCWACIREIRILDN